MKKMLIALVIAGAVSFAINGLAQDKACACGNKECKCEKECKCAKDCKCEKCAELKKTAEKAE